MMGMVLGHIFNHVTKRVPAWETRLCFSNPAGRLRPTPLRSAHSHNSKIKKSDGRGLHPGPQHVNCLIRMQKIPI